MSEDREQQTTESDRRPPPGLANGADPGDEVDEAGEPTPPSWREDWRAALAAGDERRAKQLERYASPETFAKAAFEAQQRLRSGRAVAPEPPEEATDLEIAAWRKSAGVPEKPEGYEISFPDGVEATDNDKAELAQFLQHMHSEHVTPKAAKAAFSFYMNARAASAERAAQAAEEQTLEELAELRKEYPGREYKRNLGLANDYLNNHFAGPAAQKALDQILNARLPNGVQLLNHAGFVRFIVSAARAAASEDDLISGDSGGGARSNDEEFRELAAKPRLTDAERNRMTQLAEARIRREEKAAAR